MTAIGSRPFCAFPTGINCPMDYINFTKEAEFEYMPVSYQTGTYDQKWVEKLCVQNYRIGAVLTEMYTHAEHLQKTTEVKTRGYGLVMNGSDRQLGSRHMALLTAAHPAAQVCSRLT